MLFLGLTLPVVLTHQHECGHILGGNHLRPGLLRLGGFLGCLRGCLRGFLPGCLGGCGIGCPGCFRGCEGWIGFLHLVHQVQHGAHINPQASRQKRQQQYNHRQHNQNDLPGLFRFFGWIGIEITSAFAHGFPPENMEATSKKTLLGVLGKTVPNPKGFFLEVP